MKLKYTFVINELAGQTVAVPIDCEKGEQSIIKTNETGAYILELLQNDISKPQIIEKINADYEIDDQARLEALVDSFIEKLKAADVLIDE
jgi:hypothetical protein